MARAIRGPTLVTKHCHENPMQQAVLAHFRLSESPFGSEDECDAIADLSLLLLQAIDRQGVGEFDGEESGEGRCVFFMYGPDADRLFDVVEPILKAAPLPPGGFVIKRYGDVKDPDAIEVRVDL
jgi:hypothetical protein